MTACETLTWRAPFQRSGNQGPLAREACVIARYSLNADFRLKRISIPQRFLGFHTSPDLAKRYRVELDCRDLPYLRRRETFDNLAREYEAERFKNKAESMSG
jgi:hypothetical protein